jgi:hypothetical protein
MWVQLIHPRRGDGVNLPLAPIIEDLGLSSNQARLFLRVSGRQWRKYSSDGLPLLAAERFADKIRRHPAELWPNWAEMAAERPLTRQREYYWANRGRLLADKRRHYHTVIAGEYNERMDGVA